MRKFIGMFLAFLALTILPGCGYFDKTAKDPQPVTAGDIKALETRAAAIQNDAAALRKDIIDLGNKPAADKKSE